MIAELYDAISGKVMAITEVVNGKTVPKFKNFDWWRGQPGADDELNLDKYDCPAVFFEFVATVDENIKLGNNAKVAAGDYVQSQIEFRLHIVTDDKLSIRADSLGSYIGGQDTERGKGIKSLNLYRDIWAVLHNYQALVGGGLMTKLSLKSREPAHVLDKTRNSFILTFKCLIYESVPNDNGLILTSADPDVDGTIDAVIIG